MSDALLLVDAQRDYFGRAGLRPTSDVVIVAIERLLAAFRARRKLVLHSHTQIASDGSDAMPHWRAADRLWCREGTTGALPPDGLAPLEGEPRLTKRFFSPFENPELLRLLAEQRIARLVVAGLYTHACVRSAAVDAYANGLEVLVATDAVASCEQDHAMMTIAWLDGRAARCLPTDRILEQLGSGKR